mmetsp:Transcript_25308/g.45839  ORF Transcript_25308/g.45839 Transcript_25308/m.45839 type:complete len:240 (-) Transcript_25308:16-735(-)
MARAGDSTLWTKVTPAIWCMISGTSFGLVIAVIILLVMCSISLFPMTSHAPVMASDAAFLICFLVSHIHAVTSGTISGRAIPSCVGAESLKLPSNFNANSRTCHFFSTGSWAKSMGNNDLMANGLILVQIATAVSALAARTAGLFAVACSKHAVKHSFVNASALGQVSANALTVASPARASSSSDEAHFATRESILAARPDLTTPSLETASAKDVASLKESFSSIDSIDMVSCSNFYIY